MKQDNAIAVIGDGKAKTPTVERNRSTLRQLIRQSEGGALTVSSANKYTSLASSDDVAEMRRELSRALMPATEKQAMGAVAMLVGSYRKSDLENPDIFVRSLVEDLSGYPADVLAEMVGEIRRTLKWFPTIAECVAVCESLIARRRAEARAVEQLAAEHERRERQAEEDERRRLEEDARLAARAAKLATIYSADFALDVDELDSVERGALRVLGYAWRLDLDAALDRGETWAIVAAWCLSVVTIIVGVGRDEVALTPQQVAHAIELMPGGYMTARDFALKASSGEVKRGIHRPGSDQPYPLKERNGESWGLVEKIAVTMVARIRERWELPLPNGQWVLVLQWARSQGMNHQAAAEFYERAGGGDAEGLAIIARLEQEEATRIASIDVAARTREAMAELFGTAPAREST